jgi:hypothetical protein
MLAGQHLDLSKNGTGPIAQDCGVFMPQNVEASKQEGQKQTWQLASHWEITTYHIVQGYNLSQYHKVTEYYTSTSVKLGLLASRPGQYLQDSL